MQWLFLSLAIMSEVFGSSMLKLSDGFSKLWPTIGVILGFCASFYFLSLALKAIPLATAYAIWAGAGLILTCMVAITVFNEKADIAGFIGIAFIIAGVVILHVFSKMSGH